jgi:hypothetical protein
MDSSNLESYYQIFSLGAIIRSEFKIYSLNPTQIAQESIIKRLNEWQKLCETNNLYDSLCQAYLLHANLELSNFQFDNAEDWLIRCLEIAKAENLSFFEDNAQNELELLYQRKKQITALLQSEIPLSFAEQEKTFQEYIQKALVSLRKDEN